MSLQGRPSFEVCALLEEVPLLRRDGPPHASSGGKSKSPLPRVRSHPAAVHCGASRGGAGDDSRGGTPRRGRRGRRLLPPLRQTRTQTGRGLVRALRPIDNPDRGSGPEWTTSVEDLRLQRTTCSETTPGHPSRRGQKVRRYLPDCYPPSRSNWTKERINSDSFVRGTFDPNRVSDEVLTPYSRRREDLYESRPETGSHSVPGPTSDSLSP